MDNHHSAQQSALISKQLEESAHNLNSGHSLPATEGAGGGMKSTYGGSLDNHLNSQASHIHLGIEGAMDSTGPLPSITGEAAFNVDLIDGAMAHHGPVAGLGDGQANHMHEISTANFKPNAGLEHVGAIGAMEVKQGAGFPSPVGGGAGGGH